MTKTSKAPAKNAVRIGHGNVYVGNPDEKAAVETAMSLFPHSWGWNEGSKLPHVLRGDDDYDLLSSFGFEDKRDANDCVMQVRKSLNVRHFSMTQVCDDAQPAKLAHDRTFSMIAYEAPMLGPEAVVCHISIHPNWVKGFKNPKAPIVREYVESIRALDAMITFAKALGWFVVVTGDFNLPKSEGDREYVTSYDVFRKHHLSVTTVGIDGVAWDRRLRLHAQPTVIGKAKTKSDHPWLVVDFTLG